MEQIVCLSLLQCCCPTPRRCNVERPGATKLSIARLYGDMLRVGGDLAMKLMGGASNADSAGKTFGLGSSSRESFGGKFETLYFGGVEPKDESKNKANAKL